MKSEPRSGNEKSFHIESAKINDIVERRFLAAPPNYKENFPLVLRQHPLHWVSIANDRILALIFVSKTGLERINDYRSKNYLPFPGLYTTLPDTPAVFTVDGKRFVVSQDSTVRDSVAYSIGKDSSFIIINHCQILTTPEAGTVKYTVPLAYVISFGDNITPDTAYDHLDELIAYSVNIWRQSHG